MGLLIKNFPFSVSRFCAAWVVVIYWRVLYILWLSRGLADARAASRQGSKSWHSTLAGGCVWFLLTSDCLGIFHDIYSPCKQWQHKNEVLLAQTEKLLLPTDSDFQWSSCIVTLSCQWFPLSASVSSIWKHILKTGSGLRLRRCRPLSAVRAHLVSAGVYFHSSLESILSQSWLACTYYSVLLRNTDAHSCKLHTINKKKGLFL